MRLARLRDKLPDAAVMLAVVTVTGCVMASAPRPVEVSLDRSELTVRLSDRSVCTGPVAATRGQYGQVLVSGEGRLDCPVALGYWVTADAGLNPVRLVFEEVFGAIGLGDAIAPAAEVEITAPDGRRWTFASPEPAGS